MRADLFNLRVHCFNDQLRDACVLPQRKGLQYTINMVVKSKRHNTLQETDSLMYPRAHSSSSDVNSRVDLRCGSGSRCRHALILSYGCFRCSRYYTWTGLCHLQHKSPQRRVIRVGKRMRNACKVSSTTSVVRVWRLGKLRLPQARHNEIC
jgi:hypothetical protein